MAGGAGPLRSQDQATNVDGRVTNRGTKPGRQRFRRRSRPASGRQRQRLVARQAQRGHPPLDSPVRCSGQCQGGWTNPFNGRASVLASPYIFLSLRKSGLARTLALPVARFRTRPAVGGCEGTKWSCGAVAPRIRLGAVASKYQQYSAQGSRARAGRSRGGLEGPALPGELNAEPKTIVI